MDVQRYLERREALRGQQERRRILCNSCLQPEFACYCRFIKTFDPKIKFVILIHPIEMHRRIATGRMAHLCLKNSRLIMGQDYSHCPEVNALLADPQNFPVILYPGPNSANLSEMSGAEKAELFPKGKKPVVFVIDGTWSTAGKTLRRSKNLFHLPRICFTPVKPSSFRVRKQPRGECYSTIEAIQHTIELIGDCCGFATQLRKHDQLLYAFDRMVEIQLSLMEEAKRAGSSRYRRVGT